MKSLIEHLENKIIINDLLIKKMKYEVQLIFRESSRTVQAKALAKKINNQLDTALVGLKDAEKLEIRQTLVSNSFMVIPNPISENINYQHVFTTLTNFDETTEETYLRLTRWLNLNTELDVKSQTLENYVHTFKINQDDSLNKRLNISPPKLQVQPTPEAKEHFLKQYWFILPMLLIVLVLSFNKLVPPNEKVTTKDIYVKNNILLKNEPTPEIISSKYPTYTYLALDYIKIYKYLNEEKNSMLTTSSYLTTLNTLAEEYDTDPLLLIAIIGHEQNFVPMDHPDANMMIKNPYNVYGSWVTFHNSFEESTTICLNTIQTSKDSLPPDTDLIQHLNSTYAEDKEWYKGVQNIYSKLKKLK